MKLILTLLVLVLILTGCSSSKSNTDPNASSWDNTKWAEGKWKK
jgi:PBP1b-binding outer membrane lipoprotein LpoB